MKCFIIIGAANANPESPFAELQQHSPAVERLKFSQQSHKKTAAKEGMILLQKKV